eukprot:1911235-Rhodomonas_salina.1
MADNRASGTYKSVRAYASFSTAHTPRLDDTRRSIRPARSRATSECHSPSSAKATGTNIPNLQYRLSYAPTLLLFCTGDLECACGTNFAICIRVGAYPEPRPQGTTRPVGLASPLPGCTSIRPA